ncbi:hypothetical protein [Paracoccus sp. ME4]|uniref:hypothetical protein n=1 Tax=Paracoccus sp. ME4 TaxID=3138066 RepID=UPI00398ACF14
MRPLAGKTAPNDASALSGPACFGMPVWDLAGFDAGVSTLEAIERRALSAGSRIPAGRHYPRIQTSHQTSQ